MQNTSLIWINIYVQHQTLHSMELLIKQTRKRQSLFVRKYLYLIQKIYYKHKINIGMKIYPVLSLYKKQIGHGLA